MRQEPFIPDMTRDEIGQQATVVKYRLVSLVGLPTNNCSKLCTFLPRLYSTCSALDRKR